MGYYIEHGAATGDPSGLFIGIIAAAIIIPIISGMSNFIVSNESPQDRYVKSIRKELQRRRRREADKWRDYE